MNFSGVLRQSFSTAEAARLTGLSPRQLDHWDRQGFLGPSLERAAGYGSARRYSFADVVRLRVAAMLRAAGVGLARIRRCAEELSRLDPEQSDLGQARLLVAGNRVLWARSERELIDLLNDGQMVLVFPVGDAVEAAAGAVARLAREDENAPPASRRSRRQR
jgi:DNA-binding transcriptional MerR regulator